MSLTATDLAVVSTFAGVGGIDLAAENAGMRTVLACEIDKPCRAVLAQRFPDAVIHDDVRTLTADDLRRAGAVPGRTVLTAGFPCQDLSVAGRRKGMGEGTRSGLFWHVDRLLAEFRPAWVVLENVAGLLSATCACPGDRRCGRDCPGETHQVKGGACDGQCIARHGGVMGAVLGSLANRGYGFAYRVLDARFFGVPQRRRRVIIVGRLGDSGAAPAEILFEPEGVLGDSAAGGEAWSGVAGGVGAGVARGGRSIGFAWQAGGDGTASGAFSEELSPTLQVNQTMAVGVLGDHSHALTAEGADASEDGTGRGTPVIAIPIQDGRDIEKSQNGLGVGAPEDPSFTIDTTGAQAVAYIPPVAFGHTNGIDIQADEDVYPTIRAGHDAVPSIAYVPDTATCLTAREGKGPDSDATNTIIAMQCQGSNVGPMGTLRRGNGGTTGGVPFVAYTAEHVTALDTVQGGPDDNDAQGGRLVAYPLAMRGRDEGAELEVGSPGDPAFALRSGNGGSSRSQLVAIHENQRGEITLTPEAGALATPGGKPGQGYAAITDGVIVRRLTPLETERLQGFPDGWTDVPGSSDSQRYRQMGNSVAVPVLTWVTRRLAAVDALSLEGAA